MATPSINGTPIPNTLDYRGTYRFKRFDTRTQSGAASVLTDEFKTVQWQFWSVKRSELLWWNNTLLGGAPSLQITSAELWDDNNNEQTYTDGTVYPMIPFKFESGLYWACSVMVKGLS